MKPDRAPRTQSASEQLTPRIAPRIQRSGLLLLAALLIVPGCINQDKEVAKYRKVLDEGDNAPIPSFADGQPLSLETSLVLANRTQERLAVSGEDYLQALISRDRAYANFMPSISLAPTYTWQDKLATNGSSGVVSGTGGSTGGTTGGTGGIGGTGGTDFVTGSAGNKRTRFDVPIEARANLFNGFRDVAALHQAYANINQRRALLLDLQATVLLEVAQTYYQILRSERSVQVLTNSAEYQRARIRDIRERVRAGVAVELDVAQTEAQAAATRVSLISAQNDVRNGRATLAFLVGAPVEGAKLADGLIVPDSLLPLDDAMRAAQNERQDIAAARAAVEAARQALQVAVGQYYPSISVNLNYYLHRDSIPTNSEWNGLLSANLPLFTGGIIYNDVRIAMSQLRQANLQEHLLQRQVRRDVQVAYDEVLASRARLGELRYEVRAAQDALRQAEQRYSAQLAAYLDLLTAQDRLLSAQLDLATESFNYKLAFLNLARVVGRLNRPQTVAAWSGATSQPSALETSPGVSNTATQPVPGMPDMTLPPPAGISNTQPTTRPLDVPAPPTTQP